MKKCKICGSNSVGLFTSKVLFKYQVQYFQCGNCSFIQTEEPYWLEESYLKSITDLDLGYVTRNILFSEISSRLIRCSFERKGSFLDYGGGYGMFVRLMRDRGFDFYREDKYSNNIFSEHFDLADAPIKVDEKFELLTAFEVFEHLEHPLTEIEKMMEFSESIFFSTKIQPKSTFTNSDDWSYFLPEIGQHISFFSLQSLKEIAKKYNYNIYSSKYNLHLLTTKKFRINPLLYPTYYSLILDKVLKRNFSNPMSLLMSDYQKIKLFLYKNKNH